MSERNPNLYFIAVENIGLIYLVYARNKSTAKNLIIDKFPFLKDRKIVINADIKLLPNNVYTLLPSTMKFIEKHHE